jgi:hypothetical protein
MDINKIFGLFSSEGAKKEAHLNFEEHPLYSLKMFIKIHQKQNDLNNILKSAITPSFSQVLRDSDTNEEDLAEYVANVRAFYYLNKLDITNKLDREIIQENSSDELIKYLDYSRKFFENLEHYEKCAFLKQIKEVIK